MIKETMETPIQTVDTTETRVHNHYFRKCGYAYIDVYRVLELFNVTDPCLQHIAKKALCAGLRGHKGLDRDIQDIIDTATRKLEMMNEQPTD